MIALFGDYIVRCLFSKHWTLRDAAISKVHITPYIYTVVG